MSVAVLEELAAEHLAVLREHVPADVSITAPADAAALAQATCLLVRSGEAKAAVIAAAPALRRVVRIDLGGGSVDEAACEARGIPIDVVQSVSLISVAEHAVMSILMLLKRFAPASERLRAGVVVGGLEPALTTQESYAYNWVGLERFAALRNQTVGLVGLGRIGSHAAHLLRAFGADVVYTKRARLDAATEAALGVRYLPFDELLAASICVSLHNRFDGTNEQLMGAREFGLMPTGSFFVNTARGRLVDEDALVAALASGHLAGAALDVFRYEPLPPESPLLTAPGLLLTPHTGGIPMAESQVLELREAGRLLAGALRTRQER